MFEEAVDVLKRHAWLLRTNARECTRDQAIKLSDELIARADQIDSAITHLKEKASCES